jgi:hypothetical protein
MQKTEVQKAATIALDAQDEFVKKLISLRKQPDISKDEIILLFTLLFDLIDKNDRYFTSKNIECIDHWLNIRSKIIEIQNNKDLLT